MNDSLAAVFVEPGRPLELRRLQIPALQAGEMLVKISACTICGSDLHSIRGARQLAGSMILGHEIMGTIAATPADGTILSDGRGTSLKIGDRVTWSIMASCDRCHFCLTGIPQKCESLFKYGHEVISDLTPLSGGLAEYCIIKPGTHLVKLPDELPDLIACPANCATATVSAAMRVAGGFGEKRVVVHGAGMLGLTAVAMASHYEAQQIVVTDVSSARLELAREFGASHTILVTPDTNVIAEITKFTAPYGADMVLEMSGSSTAIQQSLEILAIGGRLILVGSVFPVPEVTFLPEQIVRKLIRIEGVHNYVVVDLVHAVDFLRKTFKIYPYEKLFGHPFSLAEINAAIEEALSGRSIRTAVIMG
ncbi:MAG: zinc-binding dehydrogenase [Planctomycetota bacterium]|nr:zinc-binding dehydrogenase [Planctomycetota bacterium]MDA1213116.1 zinc-binding dehydrogenase [Planctomycetota bacterium]